MALFASHATETTLAALRDIIANRSSANGDATLVSGTKYRYRREFTDPALSAFTVVTGPGMTVTSGTGTMTITTGTTANSVTTVTTKQTFSAPFKAAFGFRISQRIANQEFYAEVIAINDDGSTDESTVAAWRISGTDTLTTGNARYDVRNGGTSRLQSGNLTSITTTSDGIWDIVLESDEVQFHCRGMDTASSRTASYVRNSVAPDPTRKYALRFRVVNGATAPASTSSLIAQFITAIDYTETQVELTGGPGNGMASQAVPVIAAGGSFSMSSGALTSSSTANGLTPHKVLSAATTNGALVKNSQGRIYGYQLANTHATAWRYLKMYNLATAPTVGTSTPIYTIPIAPASTVDLAFTIPVNHLTGIAMAITANPADNDATAVGAGEVVGHILYA